MTLLNLNRNSKSLILQTEAKEKSAEKSPKKLTTDMRILFMHPLTSKEVHGSTQPIKLMGKGKDIKLS